MRRSGSEMASAPPRMRRFDIRTPPVASERASDVL
jgi:hypothetical protein